MSDAADYSARLNLADVVARVERAQAETRKFVAEHDKLAAEQRKLNAEHDKLAAEQRKLSAEAAKLSRDRFLAPALALAATLGAIATFAPAIIRAIGGHG